MNPAARSDLAKQREAEELDRQIQLLQERRRRLDETQPPQNASPLDPGGRQAQRPDSSSGNAPSIQQPPMGSLQPTGAAPSPYNRYHPSYPLQSHQSQSGHQFQQPHTLSIPQPMHHGPPVPHQLQDAQAIEQQVQTAPTIPQQTHRAAATPNHSSVAGSTSSGNASTSQRSTRGQLLSSFIKRLTSQAPNLPSNEPSTTSQNHVARQPQTVNASRPPPQTSPPPPPHQNTHRQQVTSQHSTPEQSTAIVAALIPQSHTIHPNLQQARKLLADSDTGVRTYLWYIKPPYVPWRDHRRDYTFFCDTVNGQATVSLIMGMGGRGPTFYVPNIREQVFAVVAQFGMPPLPAGINGGQIPNVTPSAPRPAPTDSQSPLNNPPTITSNPRGILTSSSTSPAVTARRLGATTTVPPQITAATTANSHQTGPAQNAAAGSAPRDVPGSSAPVRSSHLIAATIGSGPNSARRLSAPFQDRAATNATTPEPTPSFQVPASTKATATTSGHPNVTPNAAVANAPRSAPVPSAPPQRSTSTKPTSTKTLSPIASAQRAITTNTVPSGSAQLGRSSPSVALSASYIPHFLAQGIVPASVSSAEAAKAPSTLPTPVPKQQSTQAARPLQGAEAQLLGTSSLVATSQQRSAGGLPSSSAGRPPVDYGTGWARKVAAWDLKRAIASGSGPQPDPRPSGNRSLPLGPFGTHFRPEVEGVGGKVGSRATATQPGPGSVALERRPGVVGTQPTSGGATSHGKARAVATPQVIGLTERTPSPALRPRDADKSRLAYDILRALGVSPTEPSSPPTSNGYGPAILHGNKRPLPEDDREISQPASKKRATDAGSGTPTPARVRVGSPLDTGRVGLPTPYTTPPAAVPPSGSSPVAQSSTQTTPQAQPSLPLASSPSPGASIPSLSPNIISSTASHPPSSSPQVPALKGVTVEALPIPPRPQTIIKASADELLAWAPVLKAQLLSDGGLGFPPRVPSPASASPKDLRGEAKGTTPIPQLAQTQTATQAESSKHAIPEFSVAPSSGRVSSVAKGKQKEVFLPVAQAQTPVAGPSSQPTDLSPFMGVFSVTLKGGRGDSGPESQGTASSYQSFPIQPNARASSSQLSALREPLAASLPTKIMYATNLAHTASTSRSPLTGAYRDYSLKARQPSAGSSASNRSQSPVSSRSPHHPRISKRRNAPDWVKFDPRAPREPSFVVSSSPKGPMGTSISSIGSASHAEYGGSDLRHQWSQGRLPAKPVSPAFEQQSGVDAPCAAEPERDATMQIDHPSSQPVDREIMAIVEQSVRGVPNAAGPVQHAAFQIGSHPSQPIDLSTEPDASVPDSSTLVRGSSLAELPQQSKKRKQPRTGNWAGAYVLVPPAPAWAKHRPHGSPEPGDQASGRSTAPRAKKEVTAVLSETEKQALSDSLATLSFKPCGWRNCNIVLNSSHTLSVHVRKHWDGVQHYPFLCSWTGCNQKFAVRYDLLRHLLRHCDQLTLDCPLRGCKAKFNQGRELLEHFSSCRVLRDEQDRKPKSMPQKITTSTIPDEHGLNELGPVSVYTIEAPVVSIPSYTHGKVPWLRESIYGLPWGDGSANIRPRRRLNDPLKAIPRPPASAYAAVSEPTIHTTYRSTPRKLLKSGFNVDIPALTDPIEFYNSGSSNSDGRSQADQDEHTPARETPLPVDVAQRESGAAGTSVSSGDDPLLITGRWDTPDVDPGVEEELIEVQDLLQESISEDNM